MPHRSFAAWSSFTPSFPGCLPYHLAVLFFLFCNKISCECHTLPRASAGVAELRRFVSAGCAAASVAGNQESRAAWLCRLTAGGLGIARCVIAAVLAAAWWRMGCKECTVLRHAVVSVIIAKPGGSAFASGRRPVLMNAFVGFLRIETTPSLLPRTRRVCTTPPLC